MLKFLSDSITTKAFTPYYQQQKVQDQEKKQQNVASKVLLATLTGKKPEAVLADEEIEYGKHGKPFFSSKNPYFNLAHSHEGVIAAIADEPIGIDLEKIRPFDYHKIHRAFTPSEINYLEGLKGKRQAEQALRLWTVKEAVLKQIGLGLPGKPNSVQTDLPHIKFATKDGKKYKIDFLDVGFNYIGTLARQVAD